MKPYIKDKQRGQQKFVADFGWALGISKLGKLIAKNANRSRKKALRQQVKIEIKNTLDQI